jgi:hypothetical protein
MGGPEACNTSLAKQLMLNLTVSVHEQNFNQFEAFK